MRLIEDLLNGKHFPASSRERLKAVLVSLVALLSTFIMLIDVKESISSGYIAMAVLESISALSIFIGYLLFPRYILLEQMVYNTVFTLCFLVILSLSILGANHYFALFWLATLPVYIFFFFGLERGIKWSIAIVLVLLLTILNSALGWLRPLYSYDFLMQLTVGYIAISYLLYSLEHERQKYEESLVAALKQKEVLLKEVHHRTKNNMQVMMALLDTQSFKVDDPKYKRMFCSHVDRLKAMALVHEHLYSGESYERVAIDEYLQAITDNMQQLTDHTIVSDIEPLILDMKLAMNLGLVYNEALTNAIEHAYAKDEQGIIEVSLKKEDEKCVLRVKDYGKGFDENIQYKTLGLTLMQDIGNSLGSDSVEILQQNGSEIRIYFVMEEEVK